MTEKPNADDYQLTICGARDLTAADRARCIAIIREGEAVDPVSAERELPASQRLAIARRGDEIVGVGVIKRKRTGYAARVANKSGHQFDTATPELGYVAVAGDHQGHAALRPDRRRACG